ncbi:ABC transporter permease [Paracoccus sp. S-4012]|uniref:ABC transporter permease n=1 Tax=Paracoccus sp. S-4012 TaxID=2665648 RepID=UPI0012B0FBEA|nr:ABC transporter permease [Paracoccus sp. S-4012]MRX50860.1 ABC transporter permease [Paracoccus sp. S-4012]
MTDLVWLLLTASTPILWAALGEMVAERAGVLNLGVEGMMITGALAGFAVAHATGSPSAGFIGAAVAGAALSLIFSLVTLVFLANQVATGLALTLFGLGLTAMFGKAYEGMKAPAMGFDWVVWMGLLLVPALWWWLNRTRAGLTLRSVGDNHDAAHALGTPVRLVRLGAIAVGGALAGVGGAYVSIARVLQWTEGMTAGAGWIALAIVVFAGWSPIGVLAGAALFGGVTVLQLRAQAAGFHLPVQLLAASPYIATIIVLVLISAQHKYLRRGAGAAPGSLGQTFHPDT